MSWNLIILPPEMPHATDEAATLGTTDQVRTQLDSALSAIHWSSPKLGIFDGSNFRMEIALQESGEVESFMLSITGTGDPLSTVVDLCRGNEWALFDSVTGEYIDLENPSDRGWKGYHAHRDGKVIPPDEG